MWNELRQWFYFGWSSSTRRRVYLCEVLIFFSIALFIGIAAFWVQRTRAALSQLIVLGFIVVLIAYSLRFVFYIRKRTREVLQRYKDDDSAEMEFAIERNRLVLEAWVYFTVTVVVGYLVVARLR